MKNLGYCRIILMAVNLQMKEILRNMSMHLWSEAYSQTYVIVLAKIHQQVSMQINFFRQSGMQVLSQSVQGSKCVFGSVMVRHQTENCLKSILRQTGIMNIIGQKIYLIPPAKYIFCQMYLISSRQQGTTLRIKHDGNQNSWNLHVSYFFGFGFKMRNIILQSLFQAIHKYNFKRLQHPLYFTKEFQCSTQLLATAICC